MDNKKILSSFKKTKALLTGHFLLSSGLHSDKYIQCALVLQHPDIAGKLAKILSGELRRSVGKIDVVVSPAIGGIVIGQEVARALGCRAMFTEREQGSMVLRRGFEIKKGEKCIVVEDVITTGGSTKEVMESVKSYGGKVIAVCSLVDRSGGKAEFNVPKVSLLVMDIKTYPQQECPLCRKNIPMVKPGSRSPLANFLKTP